MRKIIFLLSILVICLAQLPICPNGNLPSDIFSAKVVLGLSQTSVTPDLTLASQDMYTYIYSLPLPFRKVPSVAIAVSDIQSSYSQSFSFFVRYVNTLNKQNLTFITKVDHKLSNWTKFSFNFLAETRDDLLAFNYDVSPSSLILDGQNKSETWVIPYLESWTNFNDSRVAVYLNGFQLFSKTATYPNNSFQIKVVGLKISQNGLILTINSSSTTQTDRIYLSFVVFDYTPRSNYKTVPFLNLTAYPGESKYLFTIDGIQLSTFAKSSSIVPVDMSKYSFLYGMTSFSMENNPQLPRFYSMDINLATGDAVSNTTSSNFTLIRNNFFFLKTTECSGCLGYSLYDSLRNSCVSFCPTDSYVELGVCKFCPSGTHLSGSTCITCGGNEQWNGTACKCIFGYYKNNQSVCELCPIGTTFVDGKCQCPFIGQTFDQVSKICLCPPQMYVVNGKCQQCQGGKYWDGKTCADICSKFVSMKWDGSNCICKDGFTLTAPSTCTCTANLDPSGNCIQCTLPNTIWSGTQCICKTGYKKDTVTGVCILQTPVFPSFPNYNFPYYPTFPSGSLNGWSLITIQGAIMTSLNTLSISLKLSNMPSTLVQNGVCNLCSNIFIPQTSLSTPFKTTIQYNGVSMIDSQASFTMNLQFDNFPLQNFNIFVRINPALSTSFANIDISMPASRYIDIRTLSKSEKEQNKNMRKDQLN